jgi:hypothetical protein
VETSLLVDHWFPVQALELIHDLFSPVLAALGTEYSPELPFLTEPAKQVILISQQLHKVGQDAYFSLRTNHPVSFMT